MPLPECWIEEYNNNAGYWRDYVPPLTPDQGLEIDNLCAFNFGFAMTIDERESGFCVRDCATYAPSPWYAILTTQSFKVFANAWWVGDATNGQALPLSLSVMLETLQGDILIGPCNDNQGYMWNELLQRAIAQRFRLLQPARVGIQLGHPVLKANQTFTMAARPVPVQLAHPAIGL